MADTRKSIRTHDVTGHATWHALVAEAYPRLHALLLAGKPVIVTSAGWDTLAALDGWVDGSPMTAALTADSAGSCEFTRTAQSASSNFTTLH